jgi:uroporphyrinogen decarboxylase
MTHPGIEFTGKRVIDVVTDGKTHFEAIKAVNDHFPSAAATAVMDLTVEAEAFGAKVVFSDNAVPSLSGTLLNGEESVQALKIPGLDSGRLQQYLLANKLSAEYFDKPFFSGCIGPFSLAGRLYGMTEIMTSCFMEPDTIHILLQKCTEFLITWCKALKAQGTQGVIMAEPAAGLLSEDICEEFSSNYIKQVVEAVQDDTFILILHNCGNKGQCTEAMVKTGATGLHFGNAIDMLTALEQCPSDILVMGNIDPVSSFLMGTPESMKEVTADLLSRTKAFPNFVLSSGCDTPPGTSSKNIEAFFVALDEFNSHKS